MWSISRQAAAAESATKDESVGALFYIPLRCRVGRKRDVIHLSTLFERCVYTKYVSCSTHFSIWNVKLCTSIHIGIYLTYNNVMCSWHRIQKIVNSSQNYRYTMLYTGVYLLYISTFIICITVQSISDSECIKENSFRFSNIQVQRMRV